MFLKAVKIDHRNAHMVRSSCRSTNRCSGVTDWCAGRHLTFTWNCDPKLWQGWGFLELFGGSPYFWSGIAAFCCFFFSWLMSNIQCIVARLEMQSFGWAVAHEQWHARVASIPQPFEGQWNFPPGFGAIKLRRKVWLFRWQCISKLPRKWMVMIHRCTKLLVWMRTRFSPFTHGL